MSKILLSFIVFLIGLFPVFSHASFSANVQQWAYLGQYFKSSSAQGSCTSFAVAQGGATGVLIYINDSSYTCSARNGSNVQVATGGIARIADIQQCPANSTMAGASCTCDASFDQSGSTCVPHVNACSAIAGTTSVFNRTAGYSRSNQGVTHPPVMPDGTLSAPGYTGFPPSSSCVNGCVRTLGNIVNSWSSSEPTSTGLYRISDDWEYIATATECSATTSETAAFDASKSVPACNGFLGEVNGKKQCVSTVPNSGFVSPGKSTFVGNPAAGSSGGLAGIPATGGNGGNAGGPAGPKDGSYRGSDGSVVSSTSSGAATGKVDTETGKEQAACGAPGQPKCGIDESGTPGGTGDHGQAALKQGWDSLDAALAGVQSDAGKDTSWGLVPSWLVAAGTCVPTVLYTLPPKLGSTPIGFDLCPHLPLIYTLMNLLWITWTFFAVTQMVFRVTTSKG